MNDEPLPGMVGNHPSMREVYRLVRLVAPTTMPVLIEGETGTGKELVARALHQLGPNPAGPFIDVNCAAIPESLAEAELFGNEKGAFTHAWAKRAGYLEQADGGTLFLDEAADLPPVIQAKLLRPIERGELRRVGAGPLVCSSFRLIVASSTPARELVRPGGYRLEFYQRIAGAIISLPPLRDRGADLPLLARAFLQDIVGPCEWGEGALVELARHKWPGNVRELSMVARRLALSVSNGLVDSSAVMCALADAHRKTDRTPADAREALTACDGNTSAAARLLGVPRSSFRDLVSRGE